MLAFRLGDFQIKLQSAANTKMSEPNLTSVTLQTTYTLLGRLLYVHLSTLLNPLKGRDVKGYPWPSKSNLFLK